MKTVVIWDQMDGEMKFFVTDKDVEGLNGAYINSSDLSEELEDKLNGIIAYTNDGKPGVELLTSFPVDAVKAGAQVIVCGFFP